MGWWLGVVDSKTVEAGEMYGGGGITFEDVPSGVPMTTSPFASNP